MQEIFEVMGGQESYVTGKLEAYFRAKGIPYRNLPFTIEGLQAAATHTGFFQIPQVVCPDGSWLVDTTLIIEYLDRLHPEPRTPNPEPRPRTPRRISLHCYRKTTRTNGCGGPPGIIAGPSVLVLSS